MKNKINAWLKHRNNGDANKAVASIMMVTFALFTLIYVLNLIGVFVVYAPAMHIAYLTSAVILLLPTVLNKTTNIFASWKKCLYVSLAVLFIIIITTTVTWHVVLVYAYPIALAGVYFSKRLTLISTIMTMAATAIGQLLGFYLGWCPDNNAPDLFSLLCYCMLPRFLVLSAFSALLYYLTNRTSKLLSETNKRYEKLSAYNKTMVYSFATLVENRDSSTGGHIKRTSTYVNLLSEELRREGTYKEQINDEFVNCLTVVAPLHDIGKISIPDRILQKPGRLTEDEYSIMKTHSAKGGEIIRDTFSHIGTENYMDMAYEVARFHHEKWNGKGYLEGRKESDIPLAARIMSVADVFDAVSERRCYRDAMPLERCFEIIQDGSGTDFDPVLVKAFMNIRDEITAVHETHFAEENRIGA